MLTTSLPRWSLVLAFLGALLAAPAAAQGNGNNKAREKDRPELIRRGSSKAGQEQVRRDDERRRETRLPDRRGSRDDVRYEADRNAGPPFCRSGEGHPVHGRRWCEEKGYGLGGYDLGRYDARYDDRAASRDGYGSSYDREHADFHLRHDRECRIRAAERPLDLQWQIRVRQECKARHDEWHRRMGRRHG